MHSMKSWPVPHLLTAGLELCDQTHRHFRCCGTSYGQNMGRGSLCSFGCGSPMLQQCTRPDNSHVGRSEQNSFDLFSVSTLQALAMWVVLYLQQEFIFIEIAYRDASLTSQTVSVWKYFLASHHWSFGWEKHIHLWSKTVIERWFLEEVN